MDIKCIFIVVFVLVLINQQEVDTRSDRYAIRLCENFDDISNLQLYEFVTKNLHIVNQVRWQTSHIRMFILYPTQWLDSINLLIESDEKRGIGKIYEIFIGKRIFSYNFELKAKCFLGSYSAYFTVTKFDEGKSITMETDSLFLVSSWISINFHGLCESSAIEIHYGFNINSVLFHNTIGVVLRKLFEYKLQRALTNLKIILCALQTEQILL